MAIRPTSRPLAAVLASLLTAGVLSAVYVVPAGAVEDARETPTSSPNLNDSEGSASELGEALAEAKETDEPVEVISERDAVTTVLANPMVR